MRLLSLSADPGPGPGPGPGPFRGEPGPGPRAAPFASGGALSPGGGRGEALLERDGFQRARQRDEIRRAVQSHEVPAPAPAARARLARSALSVILSVSAGVALRRARATIVHSPRAAGVAADAEGGPGGEPRRQEPLGLGARHEPLEDLLRVRRVQHELLERHRDAREALGELRAGHDARGAQVREQLRDPLRDARLRPRLLHRRHQRAPHQLVVVKRDVQRDQPPRSLARVPALHVLRHQRVHLARRRGGRAPLGAAPRRQNPNAPARRPQRAARRERDAARLDVEPGGVRALVQELVADDAVHGRAR